MGGLWSAPKRRLLLAKPVLHFMILWGGVLCWNPRFSSRSSLIPLPLLLLLPHEDNSDSIKVHSELNSVSSLRPSVGDRNLSGNFNREHANAPIMLR